MPAAQRPDDDAARVRALIDSGWLDQPSDPELDNIVRAAADLFDVPIAAISLLDNRYQHFKARIGLAADSTSRDHAFCGYAILNPDPLVVADTLSDPRFADNPLVLGAPLIRFYAGARVHGQGGHIFGALCVIDGVPRGAVAPALLGQLQYLAAQASARLCRGPASRTASAGL